MFDMKVKSTLCFLMMVRTLAADYCSQAPQTSAEHVSRWMDSYFFVTVNHKMEIPCCAKKYSSIVWWYNKGDMLSSNSTFTVRPDDPRYLVSESVTSRDGTDQQDQFNGANYTCEILAENGERVKTIEFTLFVLSEDYEGGPLDSTPRSNEWLYPGKHSSLWCSAFLGFDPLDKYNDEIRWTFSENAHVENYTKNYKYKAPGGGTIIGSELYFPETEKLIGLKILCGVYDAFGNLRKNLSSATIIEQDDPARPYKAMIGCLLIGMTLIIIICGMIARYHIEIRLVLKDTFAALEQEDDCEWDVFICYSTIDSHEMVGKFLLPQLEMHGYKCFVYERDALAGEYLNVTLPARLRKSRRMLIVLSDALLKDSLAIHVCHSALQEALSPRALRILTVQQPEHKQIPGTLRVNDVLQTILNVSRRITLPPEVGLGATDRQQNRFWSRLCLSLPPVRDYPHSRYSYQVK